MSRSAWCSVLITATTSLIILKPSESARILIVQSTSARSHNIVMQPVFDELAARGHELTMFTCFPHSQPIPNLKEVDLSHKAHRIVSNMSLNDIKIGMPNPFQAPLSMANMELETCEKVFQEKSIQRLLKSNEKFDLVITETFTADCYVLFAHILKAPFITYMTSSSLPWVADRLGLPDNPSYIPNYFMEYSPEMTFLQRLYNTVVLVYSKLLYHLYIVQQTQNLINEHFGNSVPHIGDVLKNTSLMFVNSHFSIATSRPFPPNVVEIGGIHIKNSSEPLPQDLLELLDQSPQGVIVASFGSLVRTSSIPQSTIRLFLNAFAKVPQTVIFKYEDPLTDVPRNVVIKKWLPQQKILEHRHVRAVVTHGGMASVIESVHFGKPLVGIPFYADQFLNIKLVVGRGAGLLLHLEDLTEQNIEASIKEVIDNPSYTENMKRLSLQFRDRPMTALQSAVYWTEYVIRHQGAPHLRPSSLNLPLYQYLLLDVVAVLLLPLLLLIYSVYFLFFKAVEVSPNDERLYELKKSN